MMKIMMEKEERERREKKGEKGENNSNKNVTCMGVTYLMQKCCLHEATYLMTWEVKC